MDDLSGQTLLGKFRVVRRLGAGGMGAVYEIEHLLTHHRRALKVVHSSLARSGEHVARLVREAGVAGKLRSEHIPETYDVGRLDDGSAYVLLELLEGESLRARLERGRMTPVEAAHVASQICRGLEAAHAARVIHRDLKPENVFLARERGRELVKILDFGLATYVPGQTDRIGALTDTGQWVGTPAYLSPEQAAAKTVDARSDVYAVGVILYEMLAHEQPFEGIENLPALIRAVAEGRAHPLPGSVPPKLAAIVTRAMALDPAARFPSAAAMRSAIEATSRSIPPLYWLAFVPGVAALVAAGVIAWAAFGEEPRIARSVTVQIADAGAVEEATMPAPVSPDVERRAPGPYDACIARAKQPGASRLEMAAGLQCARQARRSRDFVAICNHFVATCPRCPAARRCRRQGP